MAFFTKYYIQNQKCMRMINKSITRTIKIVRRMWFSSTEKIFSVYILTLSIIIMHVHLAWEHLLAPNPSSSPTYSLVIPWNSVYRDVSGTLEMRSRRQRQKFVKCTCHNVSFCSTDTSMQTSYYMQYKDISISAWFADFIYLLIAIITH